VQPLFEHRLELAGFDTRVLEVEGDRPGLQRAKRDEASGRGRAPATDRLLELLLPFPAAVRA